MDAPHPDGLPTGEHATKPAADPASNPEKRLRMAESTSLGNLDSTSTHSPLSPLSESSIALTVMMLNTGPLTQSASSMNAAEAPVVATTLTSPTTPTNSATATLTNAQVSLFPILSSLPPSSAISRGRTHSMPVSSHGKVRYRSQSGSYLQHKVASARRLTSFTPIAKPSQPVENPIGNLVSTVPFHFNPKLSTPAATFSSASTEFPPPWTSNTFENSPNDTPSSLGPRPLDSRRIRPKHQRSPSITLTWNGLHPDEKPVSASSLTEDAGTNNANSVASSCLTSPATSNGIYSTVTSPDSNDSVWQGAVPPTVPTHVIIKPPRMESLVWEYIQSELASTDFDALTLADLKRERVQNFLSVPQELEKFMLFGYSICLDSFLYIFTILPLRICIALFALIRALFIRSYRIKAARRVDLMKGGLILCCCFMLQYVDASRLYHSVRGQAVIKLYVIFNVLEICDKLCSAFGHDILDSLFSKATVQQLAASNTVSSPPSHRKATPKPLAPVTHLIVSLLYVFAHSMCLFYQVMTLNVAINSYNNALLTLLVSNQFVEIKGSVFKKFEKENLFQLSCSDIIERFQLSAFLLIITMRNYLELNGGVGGTFQEALQSFYELSAPLFAPSQWLAALVYGVPSHLAGLRSLLSTIMSLQIYQTLETLLTPIVVVFGSEVLVDWLKHAFITKFNHIRPDVYRRFRESLYRDLVGIRPGSSARGVDDGGAPVDAGDFEPRRRRATSSLLRHSIDPSIGRMAALVDQSPAVARRIGFVSLPLACLMIRVSLQTLDMLGFLGAASRIPVVVFSSITFSLLLAAKILLGIGLTRFARDSLLRCAPYETPSTPS
ncbi:hypothetical protein SeMB42_g02578 [Synchytrium endobioticum]|uniref:Uncharacterized protein n=1 Tax=Synchytrium endobioticum TaxID=286115 RepID=A0A507DCX2_9FUNG|nr:hypothetical protein SeMB42_g02578 [Synchytrium endobioticum]TPX50918.1 hypothetical protein SeLEV6574_g00631 [Synchytrium endobioticum]